MTSFIDDQFKTQERFYSRLCEQTREDIRKLEVKRKLETPTRKQVEDTLNAYRSNSGGVDPKIEEFILGVLDMCNTSEWIEERERTLKEYTALLEKAREGKL